MSDSLSGIIVTPISFDNGPFVRILQTSVSTLSAFFDTSTGEQIPVITPILNTKERFYQGYWKFDESSIKAIKVLGPDSGGDYQSGEIEAVENIASLIFLITADTYDAANETYTLIESPITFNLITVDQFYNFTELLLNFDFNSETIISGVNLNIAFSILVYNNLVLTRQNDLKNGKFFFRGTRDGNTYELYWNSTTLRWYITQTNLTTPFDWYETENEDFINAEWISLEPDPQFLPEVTYVISTIGLEKTIVDDSLQKLSVTFPSKSKAKLTNQEFKFDTGLTRGSLELPATSDDDFVTVNDVNNRLNFESGDSFAIEGWVNYSSLQNFTTLISRGNNNTRDGWTFYWFPNKLTWGIPNVSVDIEADWTPTLNTWYHIAVTRAFEPNPSNNNIVEGVLRLFIDGQLANEVTGVAANRRYRSTQPVRIGRAHTTGSTQKRFKGFVDGLRITKGVPRYTKSFVKPVEPFLNIGPDPNDPTSGEISGTYTVIYDTYPVLQGFPTVQVNFESSDNSSFFYRPLPLPNDIYSLPITRPDPSVNYLKTFISVDGSGTIFEDFIPGNLFYSTDVPAVCSLTVTVCADSAPNSISDFYHPHLFTNSLSTIFFTYPGVADFAAWPSIYFNEFAQKINLTESNAFTLSPGLCFYGEGHTETINLCAKSFSNVLKYIWSVNNLDENISYEINDTPQQNFSTVNIPTTLDNYPTISISLLLSTQHTLPNGPLYYYDDNTGTKLPYPFYYTTVDEEQIPNTLNNKFKNNIQVIGYEPVLSSFNVSIQNETFLPADGSIPFAPFFARLAANLYGQDFLSLNPCYDKYDVAWQWSTFINEPLSTWNLFATTGSLPKTWDNEGISIIDSNSRRSPVFCEGSNITWLLSTEKWVDVRTIDVEIDTNTALIPNLEFYLQFLDEGKDIYTTSIYNDTQFSIQGSQIISCTISAEPFDWGTKFTTLFDKKTVNLPSKGDFQIFASNKYVLTGVPVIIKNNSLGFNNVEKIEIDLDNIEPLVVLSGNDLYKDLITTYKFPGPKTIKASVYYNTGYVINDVFENFLTVLTEYDYIEPINYETRLSKLNLPWPEIPLISPNEWVTENNINSVIIKFYENIEYLKRRGTPYNDKPLEFYGWLGTPPIFNDEDEVVESCPVWTWEDVDCLAGGEEILWEDVICEEGDEQPGELANCATWEQHICTPAVQNPDCIGRHCISWKWSSLTSNITPKITWRLTKRNQPYIKKWMFEPCITNFGEPLIGSSCDSGIWNVNTPKLNKYYYPIQNCRDILRCNYQSVATNDENIIFVALKTEIKALSTNRDASFITSRQTLDDLSLFRDIKAVDIDSNGRLFVLDGVLNKVGVYEIDLTTTSPWSLLVTWGGFGTSNSKSRFSKPNDLHVDLTDNVWICDSGNRCIKQYSNTGTWAQTIKDDIFTNENQPISLVVDSQNQIHVLTKTSVRVYNYTGTFLFEYDFKNETKDIPIKLGINYNREIIYVVTKRQIIKYFRNGAFAGYILDNESCVNNITSVKQNKYRDVLICAGNKILKYVDPMQVKKLIGSTPSEYWSLNDLLIHRNEYVQNWVYNKTFERMWDNIEIFRNILVYESFSCKSYKPTIHSKDKIFIGQNEIVTSSTVNRLIQYLWENFSTLLIYFDPNCKPL